MVGGLYVASVAVFAEFKVVPPDAQPENEMISLVQVFVDVRVIVMI